MNLDDMFPGKYLPASDLPKQNGEPNAVTIVGITSDTVNNRKTGATEKLWLVQLQEFDRPMKLKPTNARKIAQVLGSENTADWIGRRINVYATKTEVAGEVYDVIRINDYVPQTAPAPTLDLSPLGEDGAAALLARFKEKGRTFDDFLRKLRSSDEDAFGVTGGREICDIPRWVVQKHVPGFDIPPDIDRETGEVREPATTAPGKHDHPDTPRDDVDF